MARRRVDVPLRSMRAFAASMHGFGVHGDGDSMLTSFAAIRMNVGAMRTNVGTRCMSVGAIRANVGAMCMNVGTMCTSVGTMCTNVGTIRTSLRSTVFDGASAGFAHAWPVRRQNVPAFLCGTMARKGMESSAEKMFAAICGRITAAG